MKRFRTRLMVLSVLPLILILGIGGVVYRSTTRQAVLDEWRQRLIEQVDLKRLVVDDWLAQRLSEIGYLAGDNVWTTGTPEQQYQEAQRFLSAHASFTAIVLVDPDGSIVMDTALGTQPPPEGASVADRPYFQRAVEGRVNISDVIVGRTSGRPLVVVAAPINESEDPIGVLIAPVTLTTVNQVIGRIGAGVDLRTYLLDSRNRPVTELLWLDSTDREVAIPTANLPRLGERTTIYSSIGGDEVMGTLINLENHDWRLVGEVTMALTLQVFEQYNSLLRVTLIALLAVSLVAVWALALSTEQPIKQLAAMSALIDRQEYEAAVEIRPSRSAPVELQEFHRSFRDMAYRMGHFVRELQITSITDPLTELPNRRHFEAEVKREIADPGFWKVSGALLLLDLDHFKQINDRRGHAAGDRILRGFASVIKKSVRESDLPARIGGEEFAVLAPRTTADEAAELAHRIRRATKKELGITVSVGVAKVLSDTDSLGSDLLSATFEAADRALYESKHRGRNRVTVYTPRKSSNRRNRGGKQ